MKPTNNEPIRPARIKYIERLFGKEFLTKLAYAKTFYYYHPDIFLDHMNTETNFKLHFFQRILIRLMAFFKYPFVVGVRGLSKTFIHFLFYMVRCVLIPDSSIVIVSPEKYQSDLIATGTLSDVLKYYPFFRKEIRLNTNGGVITKENQYQYIFFKNGSVIRIAHSKASLRGTRNTASGKEEAGAPSFDNKSYSTEISPTLSNNRVSKNGEINLHEIQGQVIDVTNAQAVNSRAFVAMKDVFRKIGNGSNIDMFISMDYEITALYGMLNYDVYLKDKHNPMGDEDDFLRNWHALWTGFMSQQMIDGNLLNNMFKLEYPVYKTDDTDWRYVLALDVAGEMSRQGSADNALVVLRFRFNTLKNDYERQVVNTKIYKNVSVPDMATDLKLKINDYNAEIIVVDANNIGEGVVSELLRDNNDGLGGLGIIYAELFPELNNEKDMKAIQLIKAREVPNARKMLYPLKANMRNTKDADMNLKIKQLLVNKKIQFVDFEKNSIKVSSNVLKHFDVTPEEDIKISKIQDSYSNFNKLYNEISNVALKESGHLELIDKTQQKDLFSAFKYGVVIMEQLILNSSYDSQVSINFSAMTVSKNRNKSMTNEQKYMEKLRKKTSKSRKNKRLTR